MLSPTAVFGFQDPNCSNKSVAIHISYTGGLAPIPYTSQIFLLLWRSNECHIFQYEYKVVKSQFQMYNLLLCFFFELVIGIIFNFLGKLICDSTKILSHKKSIILI